MDANYGIASLLPAVIAISLALLTRQVILSLILGVVSGCLVLNEWELWQAYVGSIELVITTLGKTNNAHVVVFTLLVGAMVMLIQKSGGVKAFTERITNGKERSQRGLQLTSILSTLAIFIETNIAIMTVGTLYRPLYDKLKIARERLAFIVDTCAAPAKVAMPFNSWGVFIAGLIAAQSVEQSFSVMLQSIAYNFYPMFILFFVFATSYSGSDIGKMKRAQERTLQGQLMFPNAKPIVANDKLQVKVAEHIQPRQINLVAPMLLTLIMVPIMLVLTGWFAVDEQAALLVKISQAINNGSGASSVTIAITSGILLAVIIYKIQALFTIGQSIEIIIEGMATMMTMALVMLLAFVVGELSNQLGTGHYVADVTRSWLSPALAPALIFMVSCFMAFATGTSWGTFAIMIAIAIPLGIELDIAIPLVVAAAVGGGIFGDHCSPISDTTIMASMASGTDHIDHVTTQLNYALLAGGLSVATYLILGFI